jgi:hypothetical protein
MRRIKSVLVIGWISFGLVTSFLPKAQAQQEGSGAFQFVEASPDAKIHEAEVTPGLPDDLELADLLEEVKFGQDDLVWKGRLSYGNPRALSMAVCIFKSSEKLQFYLDLNRDRVLQEDEAMVSIGASQWSAKLLAAQSGLEESVATKSERPASADSNDSTASSDRPDPYYPVRFRFESANPKVFVATAGTMNGHVKYQDRDCAARYEDRDANGRWFDSEDRLFVDLNGDGKINTISERLPCQGMRMIGGTLCAIAGDATGRSLSIEPVKEKGTIVPRIETLMEGAEVISVSGSIGSTSGFGIPIKELDEPIEVPIGDWQVRDLTITVKEGDDHFMFMFNYLGGNEPVEVKSEQVVDLELLGELKLTATSNQIPSGNGGGRILITPSLKSESGCYLRAARIGKHEASNENRLTSSSRFNDGAMVLGSSGFS